MEGRLLGLYHRLPSWAWPMVAGARGWQLRRWRYGPETEDLVGEALARDRWSPGKWKSWRQNRLEEVLQCAARRVPHYRDYWASAVSRGRSPWVLDNWPLLTKAEVRRAPDRFIADSCPSRMITKRTSGTTGTPLRLRVSRDNDRAWYALFEARCRRWYGVTRRDRWGMLGGQLVVPRARRHPPFWVWNAPLRQLYLSTFHICRESAPSYAQAVQRHRVEYLLGFTTPLTDLARALLKSNLRIPMRVVVTNGEPVEERHRALLREVFQCPVRETYGMGECVAAASECEAGRLHLWPEVGHVEFLPLAGGDNSPSQQLVCTSLLNLDMPLVRYAVGDAGLGAEPGGHCSCGRGTPVLKGLQGRSNDSLVARDGRLVYWFNPVFYGLPVEEAQIIQERIEQVSVRLVPGPGFGPAVEALIQQRIRRRLGEVEVTLHQEERLPRTTSGKFRAVVCRLRERDHGSASGRREAVPSLVA